MEPEQIAVWLEVLDKLHSRLRQLAILGLLLLVAVASDWFFRHQQLAEEQARARPKLENVELATLTGEAPSKLAQEILEARQKAECLTALNGQTQAIKIECLPSLTANVGTVTPPGSQWKIYGRELPKVLYKLVLLFAPIVLLLGTVVTVVQLRKLHFLLGSEVNNLSVQQKLNSPYFARVTTAYGQGRWSLIVVAAAINLVHVLAAYIYVPAVLMSRDVVEVIVSENKIESASIFATPEGASAALIAIWLAVVLSALSLWLLVVIMFGRLRPSNTLETAEAKVEASNLNCE